MAAHFTTLVYGEVTGNAPYTRQPNPFASVNFYPTPTVMSFPTTGTSFYEVNPGVRVNNTSGYIYSVIEVLPTGLNVHGDKYIVQQSIATLATNAG